MKRHLFTLLLLMAGVLGTLRAQQAGTIISVTPLFDYSASQTQTAINSMIPINLPPWVVNLLTDIDYGTKGYKVIYYTKDFDGNLTLASGAMIIPQGYSCNHDMMVYCHGTVFDPNEVPSRMSGAGGGIEFIFGLLYAGNGYVTVMPDYLGLGDGPDLHLYVDEKTEASATVDLMKAVDTYTGQNGIGLTGDVMISGYSQGGHAGMSTFRYLEEVGLSGFHVATAGLGSGPYDLATKQYQFIVGNPNYPTREYILYTVASCQEAYGNLYNSPSDILVAPYDQLYTTHILGQTGQTDWVPTPWPQMFVPSVYQNYTTNPNNPLRQCLQQSDVYDWNNRTETEMYYCTGDEQVAYQNSTKAEDAMEDNLPWWLFWMIPFINSTYVGGFDHFDCVIPYGILSKWHFDLYQSWCLFADEGAQERNLADGKVLDVREYNYLYTDIDVSNFPGNLASVEFLTMEGAVALRVDDLRPVDGVLQIPTQTLDRGGYVLRMIDERGAEFYAVTQLREAVPLTHPEYNPLSQDASTGLYTLDLSLLQERIDNITLYNAAQEPALVLDAAGDLQRYEFSTDGLRAGQYLVEVQTARNSYFLPLEQRPSELAAAGFEVYPNPTSGELNIDLPADVRIEQAAIYDLQGRAVWTARTFRDRSIQLRLEPGAYQLQIRLANGRQYTERILVQRR